MYYSIAWTSFCNNWMQFALAMRSLQIWSPVLPTSVNIETMKYDAMRWKFGCALFSVWAYITWIYSVVNSIPNSLWKFYLVSTPTVLYLENSSYSTVVLSWFPYMVGTIGRHRYKTVLSFELSPLPITKYPAVSEMWFWLREFRCESNIRCSQRQLIRHIRSQAKPGIA